MLSSASSALSGLCVSLWLVIPVSTDLSASAMCLHSLPVSAEYTLIVRPSLALVSLHDQAHHGNTSDSVNLNDLFAGTASRAGCRSGRCGAGGCAHAERHPFHSQVSLCVTWSHSQAPNLACMQSQCHVSAPCTASGCIAPTHARSTYCSAILSSCHWCNLQRSRWTYHGALQHADTYIPDIAMTVCSCWLAASNVVSAAPAL